MDKKQLFKKYHSRLMWEGILKALVFGLIIGFAGSLIPAFVGLMNNFNGLWIALGVLGGAAALSTPVFYFLLFRPSTKDVAARIDRLGYDERFITMLELENDDSYVAKLQREDAREKLVKVKSKRLKLSMFIAPLVVLAVVFAGSVSLTVVGAVSVEDKLAWTPGADRYVETVLEEFVQVSFRVAEQGNVAGGFIYGDGEQLVVPGQDSTPVEAIPDEGFRFVRWTDNESENPVRFERRVENPIIAVALFEALGEGEGEEPGDGEGEDPGEPQPGDGQPQPGPPNDGGDNEGPWEPDPGEREDSINNFRDGQTHFSEAFDLFVEKVNAKLDQGMDVHPSLLAMIEAYKSILQAEGER